MGAGQDQDIVRNIQKIAFLGTTNPSTSSPLSGKVMKGFVKVIHDRADDELCGTVDVQEWNATENDPKYHKGVHVNAIKDSYQGVAMLPELYSEVLFIQDEKTLEEYIIAVSHVQVASIDAYQNAFIGVNEREKMDLDNPDSREIPNLEVTGNSSGTSYSKDMVLTNSAEKNGGWSRTTIAPNSIKLENNERCSFSIEGKTETHVAKEIKLGGEKCGENAVLGNKLADILMRMLDLMIKMKTTTSMGPQPPINLGEFLSIRQDIEVFKINETGFISKRVKIKE